MAELAMEPIEQAIERADQTIRWAWPEPSFAGPYDPGEFWIERAGQRHRGKRMVVAPTGDPEATASQIEVHFPIAPQAGDIVRTPPIS
jgi:hypothetical protein